MRKIIVFLVLVSFLLVPGTGVASFGSDKPMSTKELHESMLYPIVRVSTGSSGGSGTVLYSRPGPEGYSTYVLTNHHVVTNAISVTEEWDSDLAKNVQVEKRGVVYVEIFVYHDLSTPTGTLRVEADIVIYSERNDLALLKLRYDEKVQYVATLKNPPTKYYISYPTVAAGCSLFFPPLRTPGEISRVNFIVDSLYYDMSTSQIIYGNSGGAMFLARTGEFIGVPCMVAGARISWTVSVPITHMGLFVPVERVYKWFKKEHYDFIYDQTKAEADCLDLREKEIEEKRKKGE